MFWSHRSTKRSENGLATAEGYGVSKFDQHPSSSPLPVRCRQPRSRRRVTLLSWSYVVQTAGPLQPSQSRRRGWSAGKTPVEVGILGLAALLDKGTGRLGACVGLPRDHARPGTTDRRPAVERPGEMPATPLHAGGRSTCARRNSVNTARNPPVLGRASRLLVRGHVVRRA